YDTVAPPTGQVFNQRELSSKSKEPKSCNHEKGDDRIGQQNKATQALKIAKTKEIIPKRDRQALERLQLSISSLASAVDELKLKMEEGKISQGESEEEIALWGEEIEANLERADNTTRRIHDAIKAIDLEEQEREAMEKHKKNMDMGERISVKSNPKQLMPTRVFKTHSQLETRTGNQQCVYCEDQNHRSVKCTKVTETGERRRILSEKRLCYNCTGGNHRADDCKSRLRCQKCSCKHHTSI
ncbi:hypothetical protein P5673_020859, partial [Acropora cervicornis]